MAHLLHLLRTRKDHHVDLPIFDRYGPHFWDVIYHDICWEDPEWARQLDKRILDELDELDELEREARKPSLNPVLGRFFAFAELCAKLAGDDRFASCAHKSGLYPWSKSERGRVELLRKLADRRWLSIFSVWHLLDILREGDQVEDLCRAVKEYADKWIDSYPAIVFVLGGPGSGKGTQSKRIAADFHVPHFSAGDLLRAEANAQEQTDVGRMINHCIREGLIVPAKVTVGLLKAEIERARGVNAFVIVDGFPRALEQAEEFRSQLKCDCEFVLHLQCDEQALIRRLVKRGETSCRSDDNMESIMKRLRVQKETCDPVIEYYAKLGKARRIDASGTPDEVYARIQPFFEELCGFKRKI